VTPDIRLQDPSKIYGNLFVKDAKNTVEGQQVYSTPRLLQIFSARLILEVFGSVGAVWYATDKIILYAIERHAAFCASILL